MKKITHVIIIIIFLGISTGFNNSIIQNSTIIGTWINEKDTKWKLVFSGNNCYQYYDNVLIESNTYSISNITPQCGKNVPITNYTSYLKLIEVNNSNNFSCYEINGITPQYLSLRPIDKGNILLFVKQ